MQIEEGAIVSGKVTGITDFGAFVELEDGKTGMVHISEVASGYVKDISEHLQLNQEVKAKVISVSDTGKISLSIKKLSSDKGEGSKQQNGRGKSSQKSGDSRSSAPRVWQGQKTEKPSGEKQSFEDMMASFKKMSDEKMSDLKRSDSKRGSVGYSRRGQK